MDSVQNEKVRYDAPGPVIGNRRGEQRRGVLEYAFLFLTRRAYRVSKGTILDAGLVSV